MASSSDRGTSVPGRGLIRCNYVSGFREPVPDVWKQQDTGQIIDANRSEFMYRINQLFAMFLNWLDLIRHIPPFRWTGEKLKSRWWSVCGIFGPRRFRVLQTLSTTATSRRLCCEASPVALPVCQRCIPSWSAGVVGTTSGWWKRQTLHMRFI